MCRIIYVIVEGQTEEQFIKRILSIYFSKFQIYFKPIIIETSRTPHQKHKGGFVNYNHIKRDIQKVIKNGDCYKVTTLVDFYKIPSNFPGKENIPSGDIYEKVHYLEDCWSNDINDSKFIPYIQIHEFEALLFSDIIGFEEVFPDKKEEFLDIILRFPNPELINDNPKTAPSKRIESILKPSKYSKPFHGIDIAEIIGIEKMIEKCPHFREWINKLKNS